MLLSLLLRNMEVSLNDLQKNNIHFFTKEEILSLYEKEYSAQYVTGLFGAFLPTEKEQWVRQMFSAQQTVQTRVSMVGGTVHEVAARLMFCIIKGHKLADGNKRSSILCMIGFYVLNGYKLTSDKDDLYHKTKEVAALDSQTIDDEQEIAKLTAFLKDNIAPLDD